MPSVDDVRAALLHLAELAAAHEGRRRHQELREEATIKGLGELVDFDPYDDEDLPAVPGIYIFYDVSRRPTPSKEWPSPRPRVPQIPGSSARRGDHVWEFLNAAVCCRFATDVQINQAGSGVDVTGRVREVRWGLECKVLYTPSVRRRIDRIVEGVKQIEHDPVIDQGIIAANVTNCIDHTTFRRSCRTTQRCSPLRTTRRARSPAPLGPWH